MAVEDQGEGEFGGWWAYPPDDGAAMDPEAA